MEENPTFEPSRSLDDAGLEMIRTMLERTMATGGEERSLRIEMLSDDGG